MIVHERGTALETLRGVLRQNRSAGLPRRYIPDIRDIDFNGRGPIQTSGRYFSTCPSETRIYFD